MATLLERVASERIAVAERASAGTLRSHSRTLPFIITVAAVAGKRKSGRLYFLHHGYVHHRWHHSLNQRRPRGQRNRRFVGFRRIRWCGPMAYLGLVLRRCLGLGSLVARAPW